MSETKAEKRCHKKTSKKAINYMKKANYLQTDDDKTIDYNNDAKLNDLTTRIQQRCRC